VPPHNNSFERGKKSEHKKYKKEMYGLDGNLWRGKYVD
jgi:hypothetical protein